MVRDTPAFAELCLQPQPMGHSLPKTFI